MKYLLFLFFRCSYKFYFKTTFLFLVDGNHFTTKPSFLVPSRGRGKLEAIVLRFSGLTAKVSHSVVVLLEILLQIKPGQRSRSIFFLDRFIQFGGGSMLAETRIDAYFPASDHWVSLGNLLSGRRMAHNVIHDGQYFLVIGGYRPQYTEDYRTEKCHLEEG